MQGGTLEILNEMRQPSTAVTFHGDETRRTYLARLNASLISPALFAAENI